MAGQQGREVVIVEAVRTPIGRGHREKGYYKDVHPDDLLGKTYTEVLQRSGVDPAEVEDVIAGLRPADRRAGLQRRPQRLAPGGAADRGGRDDRRPPVRLGPAGRELRRGAHRVRRPRRRDRLRRRAHGPPALRGRDGDPAEVRRGLHPEAHGEAQHRGPGPGRRDDRRPVGDPALRARRARRALAPEGGARHRAGLVRARDRAVPGQRRHVRRRPGHPPGHVAGGAGQPQARVQARREDHGGQQLADLRRRRRGAAHVAARRPTSSGSGRGRGSSTRRPSAATR